jgi:hypothetical protein
MEDLEERSALWWTWRAHINFPELTHRQIAIVYYFIKRNTLDTQSTHDTLINYKMKSFVEIHNSSYISKNLYMDKAYDACLFSSKWSNFNFLNWIFIFNSFLSFSTNLFYFFFNVLELQICCFSFSFDQCAWVRGRRVEEPRSSKEGGIFSNGEIEDAEICVGA